MPTDPNFEARAQKVRIYTLHDNTAFNAAADVLNGEGLPVPSFNAIWLWFTPAGGYDGSVNFEVSPDGGTTWHTIQGFDIANKATLITSVASPDPTDSILVHVPYYSNFRARMSGGAAGSLTVYARLVDYQQFGGT